MIDFFSIIYRDPLSFWVGFAAGMIFLYLVYRLQPRLKALTRKASNRLSSIRLTSTKNIQSDYNQTAYQVFQGMHMFADYFPLENALIEPKVIAPPPAADASEETEELSLLQQTIPYLPDAPSLTTAYSYPTLTIAEAASNGHNLCLTGRPGSGKTTALVSFAVQILKGTAKFPALQDKVPFYFQAQDILPQFPNRNITEVLTSALQMDPSFGPLIPFENYFLRTMQEGKCLLLIDGLDAVSRGQIDQLNNFIRVLLINYPSLQIVLSAGSEYLGNLVEIGFLPLGMAGWNPSQKSQYIEKWESIWPTIQAGEFPTESISNSLGSPLYKQWLLHHTSYLGPQEFVLLVHNLYTHTGSGTSPLSVRESYLAGQLSSFPPQMVQALELIALFVVDQSKPIFSRNDIQEWIRSLQDQKVFLEKSTSAVPIEKALINGSEMGILTQTISDQYYFRYNIFTGLLASRGLSQVSDQMKIDLLKQPIWDIHADTIQFLAAHQSVDSLLEVVRNQKGPRKTLIRSAANWLAYLPQNSSIRQALLKSLAEAINTNPLTAEKLRLACSLTLSGAEESSAIFRHLLKSSHASVCRAAVLASGLSRDPNSVDLLSDFLSAQEPINFASCYALGLIGTPRALEAVADALLHGSELLRRAAAETLAHHPSEGHPALREGSSMEDILVRYAVVHGLKLIPRPWAVEILDEMRIEDDQWVVRDAAQSAFEAISAPSPYIPVHLPDLKNSPWLIDYASEQESGTSDDNQVLELLLSALESDSEERKQAALSALRRSGYTAIFPSVYKLLNNSSLSTADQAEITLWYLSLMGSPLPHPQDFGLKIQR